MALDGRYAFGYLAAFLAAVVWASYSVISRRFAGVPSEAVAGFCIAAAILSLLCHVAFEETVLPSSALEWSMVALLGAFPVGLAFFVWDHGVKHGNIQLIGTAAYATPVLSTLLLTLTGYGALGLTTAIACVLVTLGAIVAALGLPALPAGGWPSVRSPEAVLPLAQLGEHIHGRLTRQSQPFGQPGVASFQERVLSGAPDRASPAPSGGRRREALPPPRAARQAPPLSGSTVSAKRPFDAVYSCPGIDGRSPPARTRAGRRRVPHVGCAALEQTTAAKREQRIAAKQCPRIGRMVDDMAARMSRRGNHAKTERTDREGLPIFHRAVKRWQAMGISGRADELRSGALGDRGGAFDMVVVVRVRSRASSRPPDASTTERMGAASGASMTTAAPLSSSRRR